MTASPLDQVFATARSLGASDVHLKVGLPPVFRSMTHGGLMTFLPIYLARELNYSPLWIGAATFDRSVGFSHRTGQVTHHIAPDIDRERDTLMADLYRSGRLEQPFRVIPPDNRGSPDYLARLRRNHARIGRP